MRRKLYLKEIIQTFLLILGVVSFSFVFGCQKGNKSSVVSNSNSNQSAQEKLPALEKILFSENGQIKACDLYGLDVIEVFKAKGSVDFDSYISYSSAAKKFVYETLNCNGVKELREYTVKTGEDMLVEKNVERVFSFSGEEYVIYTKLVSGDENELWLYDIKEKKKQFIAKNVSDVIFESDGLEFCYTEFLPSGNMVAEYSSKMYLGSLDSSKRELIANFSSGNRGLPVDITKKFITYLQGSAGGTDKVSIYVFNRVTKEKHLLVEDVKFLDVSQGKNTLLIGKKSANTELSKVEIWELSIIGNPEKKLFDVFIPKDGGSIRAKYSPDGKSIAFVINDVTGNDMIGYYDCSANVDKCLLNTSNEAIREFVFSADGKDIVCIFHRTLDETTFGKESLYRVSLESGGRSLIYDPSKLENSVFIHFIDQFKGEFCDYGL